MTIWRSATQGESPFTKNRSAMPKPILPASKRILFPTSPLRIGSPNAYTEVVHRFRSRSPLHFDIRNIQQIRSQKQFVSTQCLLFAALLERWPQVCRDKVTFTKLPTNRFVSTIKNSMKCVVNWIQLRIRIRSRNTQPHLKDVNCLSCLYLISIYSHTLFIF